MCYNLYMYILQLVFQIFTIDIYMSIILLTLVYCTSGQFFRIQDLMKMVGIPKYVSLNAFPFNQ